MTIVVSSRPITGGVDTHLDNPCHHSATAAALCSFLFRCSEPRATELTRSINRDRDDRVDAALGDVDLLRVLELARLRVLGGVTAAVEATEIDWLPVMLVAIFTALALVAVGHALVTSVSRRRRELSLLMALGFTRRQVRETVATQATTLAAFGLAIGIPAGIIAGTFVWRAVAHGLGVAVVTAISPLTIALVLAGSIVLVKLIALVPAGRAARVQPAIGLRTD